MTTSANTTQTAFYVYELPLRLWHSFNALSIIVLAITGYLIANPLTSLSGEASEHFLMGYIRFIHFTAAYLFIIGFLFRIYWAYAGNIHAKQLFMPPLLTKSFWLGVGHEILWYCFLTAKPKKYLGHNPLALLIMHLVIVWGTVFMSLTGLALYGEGAGQYSWQYQYFSSWLIPLFGQSQDVHSWHHLGMWLMICFIIIHIYVAIREDKLSPQTMLSTIVTGWRSFKDNEPVDE
jgi:Ni/Fe-hydrogenase 1 B-type cytochrome subunit